MHLTEATIKSVRAAKLKQVNQGPTVSVTTVQGALVSGQSTTTTVPVVVPKPPKAIFSIVSWNIQDYKGSKITEGKRWVHDFIKRLVEALEVDLLILIETDVDLAEATARIELSDHNTFGVDSPNGPCAFHLVGSGRTHKQVELPTSFTLDDIQNDKRKITEDLDWSAEIEAFFLTYAVSYNGKRVDYATLARHIKGSGFNPASAVFKRNGKCPWCAGAGCTCGGANTCLWCTCTDCKQAHQQVVVCSACKCSQCQERGLLRRPCTTCNSKNPQCIMCGGKPIDVWCPACHCRACGGQGEVTSSQTQPCPTCNGAKVQAVACPKCQGAGGTWQPCPGCHGGTSPFASSCHACGAKGQVPIPCGGCGGATKVPQACGTCSGGGAVTITVTNNCTHCGASGRVPRLPSGTTCDACGGKGVETIRCQTCAGARCRACDGDGEPSQDAWTYAVEAATALLKTDTFASYDVETYAAMWRTPQLRIPSKFGVGHEACDRKLAWLCTGSSLCSTDVNGAELGYHELNGSFNCRSPFTMPLWLSLDGNHVQVPLAALHAIWGGGTGPFVKARSVSVEKMLDLAISYPGADLAAMDSFDNALLLGDFNLNYDPSKNNAHGAAFRSLKTKGWRNTTLGTKTSLGTLDNGLKKMLKSSDPNQLYSMAYDHFLLKTGKDLDTHVVQAGVIDIIDMAKRMIAADPQLAADIDTDAAIPRYSKSNKSKPPTIYNLPGCKDPDLARAFYFYRDYVSDHVPILIDILVDTQDPAQAELRDRMLQHGHQLAERYEKARTEPHLVPRYRGLWTNGRYEFTGKPSFKVADGGRTVHVSGKIIRWRLDTLVVRVRLHDDDGKDTGLDIDFEGAHTEPDEILRDFKTVGITWLTGTFNVAQAPEGNYEPSVTGKTAEPPAFWRPK
ncbi:hypothetical protein [Nannocystis sp. SCPEA4]|uniref:hypothetical protein n=1 Tax=Nannocystis sp. SCPEA4 TaxID=2996787 RepID=UPI00226E7F26|nr:hypothetical protein [Nannocystis sp. SCPEA4]MCY1057544.1 hypothetical protein [Nannocystis sp. SCPEA4]